MIGVVEITDFDRDMAREAITDGWSMCGAIHSSDKKCDCDLSIVCGCKAKLEAVAKAIAAARKM